MDGTAGGFFLQVGSFPFTELNAYFLTCLSSLSFFIRKKRANHIHETTVTISALYIL